MKTLNRIFFNLVASIILLSSVSATYGQSESSGYAVGDVVGDFSLKNIDGKLLSLSKVADKGVILIFTCNTCPYSKAYESRINELDASFKSKGYPVAAINPNDVSKKPGDSYDEMIKRSKDKGFSFPYLWDETQSVARTFGASKTPHVYLLKKEKKSLVVKFIGAIDNSPWDASTVESKYVEDAVNALLENKEVAVPEAKAVGCTIKWKES